MKVITGQLKPSKGAITVLGQPIWQNPGLYNRIASVRSRTPSTAHDRAGMGDGPRPLERRDRVRGRRDGRTRDRRRRAERGGQQEIGAYSKGMRQRIKMAQALAHDPELLILDEPLSGWIRSRGRKTIRMIKDWGRAGKSVIVSSHILHEIESMTANILLINQGDLAEGNVHQIRDLIDEHPHTVHIKADETRALAREFLATTMC
jgi:ABC-2 type transport system ATP-binding protein